MLTLSLVTPPKLLLEASILSQNRRLFGANSPPTPMKYKPILVSYVLPLLTSAVALFGLAGPLQAQDKKPNIVVIMGDDIGMWNIGAYHRGMMAGKTPN